MTVVEALSIAGIAGVSVGGVVGWVLHKTVFNRLDSLEESRGAMGNRFGEGQHDLDKRLAILEDRDRRT